MSHGKNKGIRFGDPRVFFESRTTAPFVGPVGIAHDAGAVVRGAAFIEVDGKSISISLPSMAELIYFQAHKCLEKAGNIKARSFKLVFINGYYRLEDEESFFNYLQLFCLGILGLYSALESMVYELYIRKNKERKAIVDGSELTFSQFTNLGFERKITSVAAQLSGKSNIYGTELFDKAKGIKKLRTTIQHWDVERGDNYFINLPGSHPLKIFPKIDPLTLTADARAILDHYSLKA